MNNWFGKAEQESTQPHDDKEPAIENTQLPAVITAESDPATEEGAQQVALLDRAQQAIARAESVDEVKDIRDRAEAARKYAESASLGLEAQNHAAEVKLRAERKAGELIGQLQLHGGNRSDETIERVTLDELGVSKDQSSRWQLIASLPDESFDQHIQETKQAATELTTTSVLKLARQLAPPRKRKKARAVDGGVIVSDLQTLLASDERFGCVYANPPWPELDKGEQSIAETQQAISDLCELPISELVCDDAHLHLWTTNDFLFDSRQVMEAWGFDYQGCLIWVKPQMGSGTYWRVSHEFLLLGVRGSCKFRNKMSMSWVRCNRTKHIRKPDKVRQLVEKVSHGPYLELFAQEAAKGWTAHDNELSE